MEEFKWEKAININIFSLVLLGLWPKLNETYTLNFYGIYTTVCVIGLLFIHTFVQTYNIYFILNDLEALTSTIFVTLSCIAAVVKAYCLIRNMKSVKNLFIDLRQKSFQPKNESQIKLVTPAIISWKLLYFVNFITCNICVTFWSIYPILDNWIAEHRLPFLAWYPFDTKSSPNYELTYIHQVVAIWYLVYVSMNLDCFIAALNMFIGTQCDILSDNLRNLAGERMREEFISCVEHHRAILRFSEISNNIFNWIILLQFFTCAISMGFSLFQLTVVRPFSSQFYSFVCYTSGMTIEMFIFSWFGNEVEVKSSCISSAVFECDWAGAPISTQKELIIFISCAQEPIKISAFNFFYLTLETFKMVLRSSWSYFTVLNEVNRE